MVNCVALYMGTITGISDLDPVRWKSSQWRNLQVGWDESTAGERPSRVSLWEIEPVVSPFYICPPPFLRSKFPRKPGMPDCVTLPCIPSGSWNCKYCENVIQREKYVEHNANAVAARRVAGIDPLEQIHQRCIHIVKTEEFDHGGCVLCSTLMIASTPCTLRSCWMKSWKNGLLSCAMKYLRFRFIYIYIYVVLDNLVI